MGWVIKNNRKLNLARFNIIYMISYIITKERPFTGYISAVLRSALEFRLLGMLDFDRLLIAILVRNDRCRHRNERCIVATNYRL